MICMIRNAYLTIINKSYIDQNEINKIKQPINNINKDSNLFLKFGDKQNSNIFDNKDHKHFNENEKLNLSDESNIFNNFFKKILKFVKNVNLSDIKDLIIAQYATNVQKNSTIIVLF